MLSQKIKALTAISLILSGNAKAVTLSQIKDVKKILESSPQNFSQELQVNTGSSQSVINAMMKIVALNPEKYHPIIELLDEINRPAENHKGVGYEKEYDKASYSREGTYSKGYEKNGYEKTYDKSQYSREGTYSKGYDKNGYEKTYDKSQYSREGTYSKGYDKDSRHGYVSPNELQSVKEYIAEVVKKFENKNV